MSLVLIVVLRIIWVDIMMDMVIALAVGIMNIRPILRSLRQMDKNEILVKGVIASIATAIVLIVICFSTADLKQSIQDTCRSQHVSSTITR